MNTLPRSTMVLIAVLAVVIAALAAASLLSMQSWMRRSDAIKKVSVAELGIQNVQSLAGAGQNAPAEAKDANGELAAGARLDTSISMPQPTQFERYVLPENWQFPSEVRDVQVLTVYGVDRNELFSEDDAQSVAPSFSVKPFGSPSLTTIMYQTSWGQVQLSPSMDSFNAFKMTDILAQSVSSAPASSGQEVPLSAPENGIGVEPMLPTERPSFEETLKVVTEGFKKLEISVDGYGAPLRPQSSVYGGDGSVVFPLTFNGRPLVTFDGSPEGLRAIVSNSEIVTITGQLRMRNWNQGETPRLPLLAAEMARVSREKVAEIVTGTSDYYTRGLQGATIADVKLGANPEYVYLSHNQLDKNLESRSFYLPALRFTEDGGKRTMVIPLVEVEGFMPIPMIPSTPAPMGGGSASGSAGAAEPAPAVLP